MTTDLDRLQGTWAIQTLEVEGAARAAPVFHGSRIVVAGSAFTTIGMGASYGGTVTIDERSIPKTLDLHFADGPHAGAASLAIYQLDGDRWTVCLGFAGKDRPGTFATSTGCGHVLETLTRAGEAAA